MARGGGRSAAVGPAVSPLCLASWAQTSYKSGMRETRSRVRELVVF